MAQSFLSKRPKEQEAIESADEEFDSPFEESVHAFLTAKGYNVATQVGCSGYRIDLAVKHPKLSGIFVLGIECDGAMYHSSKTARERDRLRQSLLESMGWKLYRIWSTDWVKDMVNENRRLSEAVQSAIDGYVEDTKHSATKAEKERKTPDADSYVTMTNRESGWDIFSEYKKGEIAPFKDINYLSSGRIEEGVFEVVKKEGPVHHDVIYRRFSEAKRKGQPDKSVRLSTTDKRVVDRAIFRLGAQFIRKGEFFSFPNQIITTPRNAGDRSVNEIAPEELELGIMTVMNKCCGVSREDLIRTTASVFGWDRFGANIREILETTYSMLKEDGKLKEVNGVVQV